MEEKTGSTGSGIISGIGLSLAREYYEACGKPMVEEKFKEYTGRIAVGLVGRGSDCFGFDDVLSEDHDWGPEFCLFVTEETFREIGSALEEAYAGLPAEFQGYHRAPRVSAKNKRGVICISDFYRSFLGTDCYEEIEWQKVADFALAAAVNGEVFRDDEGVFSAMRERLLQGYPEEIRAAKMEESRLLFTRNALYNYPRMWKRGDRLTAKLLLFEGIKEAMKFAFYRENKYPPHDKWLYKGIGQLAGGREVAALLGQVEKFLETEPENMEAVLEQLKKISVM